MKRVTICRGIERVLKKISDDVKQGAPIGADKLKAYASAIRAYTRLCADPENDRDPYLHGQPGAYERMAKGCSKPVRRLIKRKQ